MPRRRVSGPGADIDKLQEALALVTSGKPDQALPLLAMIPADSGLYPHALHVRGIAQASQGHTGEAILSFEEALPWLADNDEFLANLARAYTASARYQDALALLDKLAAAGKANAVTYADRAVLLEKMNEDALALASYDVALHLDAGLLPAWAGKGNLLHKMENYVEALACHDYLLSVQPDNGLARSNRASTLDKLGRMSEALIEHGQAQALCPGQAAIWSGQGVCLVLLDRLEEGLHCFDQALAIDPSHLQAMINRASVLAELRRYPESLSQFDAALRCAPDGSKVWAQARTFKGIVILASGDPAGWAAYEHRTFVDQELERHNAAAQRWSGTEPLAGKRILLWGEQGYGDIIQFCRYTVSLAALGARVILEVPAPLVALCASLRAEAVHGKGTDLPPHDFQLPMMSMPLALQSQPQLVGIPCAERYLQADARTIEKWKQALPPPTRKPRIGFACSGAIRHRRNGRRSVPLEKLHSLTELAELVLLQPELTPDDAIVAAGMPHLVQPSLDKDNFADVAGLIANLDLVISVDTSIAHLAGAMGMPVWILLPWNAEWRWLTARADTPWYDSARLFRQTARNDWDWVISEVLHALKIDVLPRLPLQPGQEVGASVAACDVLKSTSAERFSSCPKTLSGSN
jgi:tetratricopeptide (TPR) repeat protein